MKKKIIVMIATAVATMCALVAIPREEVKADAFTDMNYEQVVHYWSAQPEFSQIYSKEVGHSAYANENLNDYFVYGLRDYCFNPAYLQSYCPLTYAYMAAVLGYSNPNIYNYIVYGNYWGYPTIYTLYDAVYAEVYWLGSDVANYLVSFLNGQGVYTVDQYNEWKTAHGGRTVYEEYVHIYPYWWYGYPCVYPVVCPEQIYEIEKAGWDCAITKLTIETEQNCKDMEDSFKVMEIELQNTFN